MRHQWPNHALQRLTRLLRLSFAMSLRFAQRPGGRVADLDRSLRVRVDHARRF